MNSIFSVVIGTVAGGSVSFLIGGLDSAVFVGAIIGAAIGYSGGDIFSSEPEDASSNEA